MKTLEAKPFDQNAEKLKARKSTVYIDRARDRRLGKKSNRYARTQKSSNSLIRFRCPNSCFLLETGIAVHERLFLAKWHPEAEKKLPKRRFFDTADRHEKLYGRSGLYATPKDATKLAVFFRFFSSLSFEISIKKQRAEVIFRLSRPVSCKNQENGSGKQWSLQKQLFASFWFDLIWFLLLLLLLIFKGYPGRIQVLIEGVSIIWCVVHGWARGLELDERQINK